MTNEMPDQDVKVDPPGASAHAEPVLIFNSESQEEAEVVRATLEASGIRAILENPDTYAGVSLIDETVGEAWSNGVYVMPEDAAAAQELLSATPLSDEELGDEAVAQPFTDGDPIDDDYTEPAPKPTATNAYPDEKPVVGEDSITP